MVTYLGSNCIWMYCNGDYSSTRKSHEYWIMQVIFDCSHVTVRNVQDRCCCQQDLLQAYIGWLLLYLSSVNAPLAVDSFLFTDVYMPD